MFVKTCVRVANSRIAIILTGPIMERELKNGKKYKFYQIGRIVYTDCFYDGKWNRLSRNFNTIEDALAWCDEMDYIHEHPEKDVIVACPPEDYYDDTTRYYGD